jgi:hypothetical protein
MNAVAYSRMSTGKKDPPSLLPWSRALCSGRAAAPGEGHEEQQVEVELE